MLARTIQTPEQRKTRNAYNRAKMAASYAAVKGSIEHFYKVIDVYADQSCEVCTKMCFPYQIAKFNMPLPSPAYLPDELKSKNVLIVCHTCKKHLMNKKKDIHPAKAYWNNLNPGPIPDEIKALTKLETGLLTRIEPYLKIIKINGPCGQYKTKGNATLFAKDLFQFTEKADTLPRASHDSNIIIVCEEYEGLNMTKEYTIDRNRTFSALRWLVQHNPLYKDVVINEDVQLDQQDCIRIAAPEENEKDTPKFARNQYKNINNNSRILRASFHQGENIFHSGYEGRQCCAMALAAITRTSILQPKEWTTQTLNQNLMHGDNLYALVRRLSVDRIDAYAIPDSEHLMVRNFDVLKHHYLMFDDNAFSMEFADEPEIFGTLDDKKSRIFGWNFIDGLNFLFQHHSAGIFIAREKSFAVMNFEDKFYLADSHGCGEKGAPVRISSNGKACIIECSTIEELNKFCKRAVGTLKQVKDIEYTLDYVDVHLKERAIPKPDVQGFHDALGIVMQSDQQIGKPTSDHLQQKPMKLRQQDHLIKDDYIPIQTSVMMHQDHPQPDVEDAFTVEARTIIRKTKNNLVSINTEKKAEEYAFWYLFPTGINGLNEDRPVKMTPLQYFQFRVLGSDKRFWSLIYLFYSLAIYEFLKIQSTVNICGRRIEGKHGPPDDIHTYLKNLRGTAAYWNTALHELLDAIKNLGPPHYFLTFSCNDLNWIDMKKALLIADGRPNKDPTSLTFMETQRLIEIYPVVVARQFNHRVSKLIQFMLNNDEIFGGKVRHFWYRVEIQNRGSPHIHLVVWIADHPNFDTPEGIKRINHVVSCRLPPTGTKLREIVEKFQIHRHTTTCYKGDHQLCRFRFPRPISTETKIIAINSNDFIRSCGRICDLQRTTQEQNINNYNPYFIEAWQGNMDVQPLGSDDSIAYYCAKYIAKSEPTELEQSIREAIKQLRDDETNISRKMFSICMRIQNERQVSATEAAIRLCHLKMRDSNIATVFVNTRKKENRQRLIKFDKNNRATGYCKNIFDRYEARPIDDHFAQMSITEFAMLYEPKYDKNTNDEGDENVDAEMDEHLQERRRQQEVITLLYGEKMIRRNNNAVVRVPRFNADIDPESYYYSLLLQYKPFRNEDELMLEYVTAKQAFLACEELLKGKSKYMETFRKRDRELVNALTKAHAITVFDYCEPLNNDEDDMEAIDMNGQDPMDDLQYHQVMQGLNVKQKELLQLVTNSITSELQGSSARFCFFLTGNAGCGKTHTMKAVQNQVSRLCGNDPSVVKICALTGVAAILIKGATLHSMLRLPVQKDGKNSGFRSLSGLVLKAKRIEWKNVRLFIIDEISMVSYEMLTMIDSRCRQIKNNENELFGGLNVLLCGDLLQLPPIRGSQIFDQPRHMEGQLHLWRQFTLIELDENMRQRGDQSFINILNSLRVGELSLNQLEDLMKRVGANDNNMNDKFDIGKAIRIYPTNKQVSDHNNLVLQKFQTEEKKMWTIHAQDKIVGADSSLTKEQIKAKISTDINKTAGLPATLTIFQGAKVMLRSNIDVSKKLVNGAIGFITQIIWPNFRRDQMYDDDIPRVMVEFDGGVGLHEIRPISKEFEAKGKSTAERLMLPLVLAWASTGHKMQGSTLDCEVACLSNMFQPGLAYVILSRVRSMDGLRIISFDAGDLVGAKPCNKAAKQELERMRGSALTSSNSF